MFKLVAAGVFVNDYPMPHMAAYSPTLRKAVATPGAPFSFIVTWLIPGPPHYTVTIVFARAIPEGKDPKVCHLLRTLRAVSWHGDTNPLLCCCSLTNSSKHSLVERMTSRTANPALSSFPTSSSALSWCPPLCAPLVACGELT